MKKIYRIELDELDLGQLLDGLDARVEAWEKTAGYHRTGEAASGFAVEECADAREAERIVEHYRTITSKIRKQREAQS